MESQEGGLAIHTKKNYYAPDGTQDYLIGEGHVIKNDDILMKPISADMMNRVRKTAKWSQLYKTGPSIPPKNKASFLNDPDEEDEVEEVPDVKNDAMLSTGTYRHITGEIDDINSVDVTRNGQGLMQADFQVGTVAQGTIDSKNIQVYKRKEQQDA